MAERIVFIHLPDQREAVPAGRLTLLEQGIELRGSRFAYGRRYGGRTNALPVDPVSLPLSDASSGRELVPAGGLLLFGALRDATPDLWGRRVIENRLRAPPNGLPESAYLEHAGPHRAGALDIRDSPTSEATAGILPSVLDLAYLQEAAECVESGLQMPARLDILFSGGPSLGGARPKAVLSADGAEWIAKFPLRADPFDVPMIERAILELAREAGLMVPATRLETLADGRHVLLIERFDREKLAWGLSRRHMVSALTLLGRHESESPDTGYADIADAISEHGVAGSMDADRVELYGRMLFNILVSNDDDHLRNHAFLCAPEGSGWRLSPLYDVVPRPQLAHERQLHLSVGPLGRAARLDNALAGCGRFGLMRPHAARIIDSIVRVVREWRERFEAAGVDTRQCDRIASAFPRASDIGLREVEKLL